MHLLVTAAGFYKVASWVINHYETQTAPYISKYMLLNILLDNHNEHVTLETPEIICPTA